MSFTEINFELPSGDRQMMRKTLIGRMLDENPGTGKGDSSSRYQYNVENFGNYSIFLKRPTQLNKGFDFTVNTKGVMFKKNKRYSNPSHQDIFDALISCKTNFPLDYSTVSEKITKIYNCENIYFTYPMHLTFHDYEDLEHPVEIILLAIKWLFMEQDCAYWNYSGRAMFYSALEKKGLV